MKHDVAADTAHPTVVLQRTILTGPSFSSLSISCGFRHLGENWKGQWLSLTGTPGEMATSTQDRLDHPVAHTGCQGTLLSCSLVIGLGKESEAQEEVQVACPQQGQATSAPTPDAPQSSASAPALTHTPLAQDVSPAK